MVGIDLGSNTIRAVEIDCGTLEKKSEYQKAVRAADGLYKSGVINDEALQRVIAAIKEIKAQMPLVEYHAVATAAFRNAKNQQQVLETIKQETGLEFVVIDGETEAYLTNVATRERLKKLEIEPKFVSADIGGASSEISFVGSDKFISQSFDIGIVTVSQKYQSREAIMHALPELTAEMKEFVNDMKYVGIKPKYFISTSGTPTTLAAMKHGFNSATYNADVVNGTVIEVSEIPALLEKLLRYDVETREKIAGVGRGDLIIAGVLIYKEIFKILGFSKSIIVDDSLREGVAIAKCKGLI